MAIILHTPVAKKIALIQICHSNRWKSTTSKVNKSKVLIKVTSNSHKRWIAAFSDRLISGKLLMVNQKKSWNKIKMTASYVTLQWQRKVRNKIEVSMTEANLPWTATISTLLFSFKKDYSISNLKTCDIRKRA
jgi:hypothetical protein